MHSRLLATLTLLLALSGCREQVCRDPSFEIVGDRCVCPDGTEETFNGCEPIDGGIDAMPDAMTDVGMDTTDDTGPDAVLDTATPPDPPGATTLRWPPNGHNTGSVHVPPDAPITDHPLRPKLMWEPVEGATEYQVQLDDSCAIEGFNECEFESPELDERAAGETALSGTALVFRPRDMLRVSMEAPVGTRYVWRVRACNIGGCGEWSPHRYANVGRQAADFDGDGYADVATNSSSADGASATVHVFYGNASSIRAESTEIPDPRMQRGSRFGQAIAAFGDADGDGFGDLAIGAPEMSLPESREGGVFVYFGRTGGLRTSPDVSFDSPMDTELARFGSSVAGADVDGDGYSDLLAGAPTLRSDESRGVTYLFPGSGDGTRSTPSMILSSLAARGEFGESVTVGDITADGYADVIIAASGEPFGGREGRVYVFPGSDTLPSTMTTAEASWRLDNVVDEIGSLFGRGLALGDINSDGLLDVIVGSSQASNPEPNEGNVYVYLSRDGGTTEPSRTIDNPFDDGSGFGVGVVTADLDADGFADIATTAPASIFVGSAEGASREPDHTLDLLRFDATNMATPGDLNGDGELDLVVVIQSRPARLDVFSGVSTTPRFQIESPDGVSFGVAVAR